MQQLSGKLSIYSLASLLFLNTSIYAPTLDYNTSDNSDKKTIENAIMSRAEPESEYVSTGPLAGYTLTDLAARYINLVGLVPERIKVDPEGVMNDMWTYKVTKRAKRNKWVKMFYNEKVKKYDFHDTEKMTLEDYLDKADREINGIKYNLNWDTLKTVKEQEWRERIEKSRGRSPAKNYYLDSVKVQYLSDISSSINSRYMAATFLTELMPGNDGLKNYYVTDFMTQVYGPEFLELAPPAMSDTCLSFGWSQFTSFALFDNGKERRQASWINLALPKQFKIPNSVYNIQGLDHFTSAYALAIYSLSELIGSLNEKQMKKMTGKWNSEDIIKYIILSHHTPTKAITTAIKWINNGTKKSIEYHLGSGRSARRNKGYMMRGIVNYNILIQKQNEQIAHDKELNLIKVEE
jgi:hypothetical protein